MGLPNQTLFEILESFSESLHFTGEIDSLATMKMDLGVEDSQHSVIGIVLKLDKEIGFMEVATVIGAGSPSSLDVTLPLPENVPVRHCTWVVLRRSGGSESKNYEFVKILPESDNPLATKVINKRLYLRTLLHFKSNGTGSAAYSPWLGEVFARMLHKKYDSTLEYYAYVSKTPKKLKGRVAQNWIATKFIWPVGDPEPEFVSVQGDTRPGAHLVTVSTAKEDSNDSKSSSAVLAPPRLPSAEQSPPDESAVPMTDSTPVIVEGVVVGEAVVGSSSARSDAAILAVDSAGDVVQPVCTDKKIGSDKEAEIEICASRPEAVKGASIVIQNCAVANANVRPEDCTRDAVEPEYKDDVAKQSEKIEIEVCATKHNTVEEAQMTTEDFALVSTTTSIISPAHETSASVHTDEAYSNEETEAEVCASSSEAIEESAVVDSSLAVVNANSTTILPAHETLQCLQVEGNFSSMEETEAETAENTGEQWRAAKAVRFCEEVIVHEAMEAEVLPTSREFFDAVCRVMSESQIRDIIYRISQEDLMEILDNIMEGWVDK